jgi:hypothetical protein
VGTRPAATDVWRRIDGLEITSGPADAPALFDFHALQIPFDDVWRDLVDDDVVESAARLHAEVERRGGRAPAAGDGNAVDLLRREARFLIREAPVAPRPSKQPRSLAGLELITSMIDPLGDDGTRWVSALLDELERKLAEPYRFTVYACDDSGTAINLGCRATRRRAAPVLRRALPQVCGAGEAQAGRPGRHQGARPRRLRGIASTRDRKSVPGFTRSA